MNINVINLVDAEPIPSSHIEDGLTFKDFLSELHTSWDQLNNKGKISLITEYFAEEANADFFIEETSDNQFNVVCSRLSEQVILPANDVDVLSRKITEILGNLFGCAFRSL